MPLYDYQCSGCTAVFERKLPMVDYQKPTTESCPECSVTGTVSQILTGAPALGDPVKLGFTKPPDAFLHGVLGRMQNSVPVGTIADPRGRGDAKKIKYADFSKAHYQPGRLI